MFTKNLALLLFTLTASLGVHADALSPVDSGKEIESKIAGILKERLKIDSNLRVTDEKGENLRVVTIFNENTEKNLPKIVVFIDTKVLSKRESEVLSQAISIFSTADISVDATDRLKLLEWANRWNGNTLPIRIQVVKEKIFATSNLVTTVSLPIAEERILQGFLDVIRIWPVIIDSLKKSGLLK